jgi:VirB8 protein
LPASYPNSARTKQITAPDRKSQSFPASFLYHHSSPSNSHRNPQPVAGKPQATITKFTEFRKLGEAGVNPNQTFHYQVRYERVEVINGKETRPHWTAQVYFQFHPELRATPNDRLINPYGLQVVSFSTTPD